MSAWRCNKPDTPSSGRVNVQEIRANSRSLPVRKNPAPSQLFHSPAPSLRQDASATNEALRQIAITRTHQAGAEQAIGLKLLSVGDHGVGEDVDRKHFLFVIGLLPHRHCFNVGGHRRVELVHACAASCSATVSKNKNNRNGRGGTTRKWAGRRTISAQVHLQLQGLEFIGRGGLRLASHSFPRPLLEPVKLLFSRQNLVSKHSQRR